MKATTWSSYLGRAGRVAAPTQAEKDHIASGADPDDRPYAGTRRRAVKLKNRVICAEDQVCADSGRDRARIATNCSNIPSAIRRGRRVNAPVAYSRIEEAILPGVRISSDTDGTLLTGFGLGDRDRGASRIGHREYKYRAPKRRCVRVDAQSPRCRDMEA